MKNIVKVGTKGKSNYRYLVNDEIFTASLKKTIESARPEEKVFDGTVDYDGAFEVSFVHDGYYLSFVETYQRMKSGVDSPISAPSED